MTSHLKSARYRASSPVVRSISMSSRPRCCPTHLLFHLPCLLLTLPQHIHRCIKESCNGDIVAPLPAFSIVHFSHFHCHSNSFVPHSVQLWERPHPSQRPNFRHIKPTLSFAFFTAHVLHSSSLLAWLTTVFC